MKFGRSYSMQVAGNLFTGANFIDIAFPTTVKFEITHNIWASANAAEFSIYNLGAAHRQQIAFNQYLKDKPYPIYFRAGYVSQQAGGYSAGPAQLPLLFSGFINVAYSERSGDDMVTRIAAIDNGDIVSNKHPSTLDGTIENGYTAPCGAPFRGVVETLMRMLGPKVTPPLVTPGEILVAPIPPNISTIGGRPFIGSVWNCLQDLARDAYNADVFIDFGKCHLLSQNLTLPGTNNLGTLSPSTGLLGIPRYTGAATTCSCVLEPRLAIGAKIGLKSTAAPWTNGTYKIIAFTHRGTISGVESMDATTDITMSKLSDKIQP